MYTISTTPGDRVDTAATIPDALAALAAQLTTHLPHGPVAWKITDPTGTEHRGQRHPQRPPDQLTIAVDELVDELYTQLHRAADRAAAGSAEHHRSLTETDRPTDLRGSRSAHAMRHARDSRPHRPSRLVGRVTTSIPSAHRSRPGPAPIRR